MKVRKTEDDFLFLYFGFIEHQKHLNYSVLTTEQSCVEDAETSGTTLEFAVQRDFGFLHVVGHCGQRGDK